MTSSVDKWSGRFCSVERSNHLTIVTLERPEVLNALNYEADLELDKVWNDFEDDPEQWVAILTGAGTRAFCAGNDLKAQASNGKRQFPPGGFGGLTSRLSLNKPIIAAVNGLAYGGGFELVLACDVVLASRSAVFSFPEPRVGLAALSGGAQLLAQTTGWAPAMGILLTGRRVECSEALSLGIATAVTEPGRVLDEARVWADTMLRCAPLSLQATKAVARRAFLHESARSALTAPSEIAEVNRLRGSLDYREGPLAFTEKREPVWVGR